MSSRFLAIIIWWPGKHAPAVINPSRASSGVCHLSLLIFPLDASWVPVPAGSQTGHKTRMRIVPGRLFSSVVARQRRLRESVHPAENETLLF